jgi:hypothetical protein
VISKPEYTSESPGKFLKLTMARPTPNSMESRHQHLKK